LEKEKLRRLQKEEQRRLENKVWVDPKVGAAHQKKQ
jgi:hypothetical protein